MSEHKKSLKWEFDVSTLRLIGRELITDRITALFELVKNSYDANAEEVYVEFHNVGEKSKSSRIVIRDDGIGMSYEDIRTKWMVIGTKSKRIKTVTDEPYKRPVVGEKGLGRFAVDKLGRELILKTKKREEKKDLFLKINWSEYEKLFFSEEPDKNHYFTDMENEYWEEPNETDVQGTELIIKDINEIWSKNDIIRAYKELSKLISPFEELYPPFNIYLYSNEHLKDFNNVQIKNQAVKYASLERILEYDLEKRIQQVLKFEEGDLKIEESNIKVFGPVRFTLFYFDQNAKQRFKRAYKDSFGETLIDGVKIYRDGVITTPFAEYEGSQDKQRDILGIDKRRYSGFWDKVNSRDLIGIIEIKKANNPNIIESSNRQDFTDNEEYRELKQFIVDQFSQLERYLNYKKEKKSETVDKGLDDAKDSVDWFIKEIQSAKEKAPELSQYLEPLETKAKKAKKDISQGIIERKKLQKEKKRQENLFFSLMSLQEYAQEMAHVIRTVLERILHKAEFIKRHFPNEKYQEVFKEYAVNIYSEIEKLSRAADFMLSYAKSDVTFEEIDIRELVDNLFFKIYSEIFENDGIKPIVEIEETFLIYHNRKFLEDIFLNLITNSRKALKDVDDKIIKCSGFSYPDEFVIYFSDNGRGIDEKIKSKIFDIYQTTTAEEGGAGIGLFIVKKRIEALKGKIEVIESEFKPKGATFKIIIPFKKDKEN